MKKEVFEKFTEETIEAVIQLAEVKTNRNLSRKIAFQWFFQNTKPITENIVENITERIFIDENHICPCVDIGVGDMLEDGTLIIFANVAGYEPKPFGKNWQGNVGPYIHIIGQTFLDKMKVG
ncbi:MAG: hypothetical protein ABI891_09755 [Acidobacteriota bacterium]